MEEALQSQDDESSHEPGHSPQASGQAARAATPASSFTLQFLGFVAAQAQSRAGFFRWCQDGESSHGAGGHVRHATGQASCPRTPWRSFFLHFATLVATKAQLCAGFFQYQDVESSQDVGAGVAVGTGLPVGATDAVGGFDGGRLAVGGRVGDRKAMQVAKAAASIMPAPRAPS